MSEDVDLHVAVLKARSASPTKQRAKLRRGRKRSFWQSDSEVGVDGSKQAEGAKRKKRKLSKRKSEQIEHKFLIGGDISDPLNLKTDELPGVDDVEVSSSLHREDDCSIPAVPHPQTDPLQLEHPGSDHVASKEQKSRKKRKRKRKTSESQHDDQTKQKVCGAKSVANDGEEPEIKVEARAETTLISSVEMRSKSTDTKTLDVGRTVNSKSSHISSPRSSRSSKEQEVSRFRYGNYYRYYGYRNPGGTQDERLKRMKSEWFEGKRCLDIGCNVGHFTLSIARDFKPQLIVGLDIDSQLISIAKKNIRHYLSPVTCEVEGRQVEFPLSLVKSFGPIAGFPLPGKEGAGSFPNNVKFQAGNWVVKTDAHLGDQKPEYDVVLLLSTTKWIHLNWGDEGVKRAFKRVFLALKPGGVFIMEPQELKSYTKKKKLTPEIFANYKAMQLYPDQFSDYLLSEVGFSSCQELQSVHSECSGFTRPILMYMKPDK